MFNLADYVALTEVINDRNVAEEKHLTVKKVYQKTPCLQKLEDELRAVPSDDPDWRDKVMGLKKQVAEEKANLARYIIKYQKHYLNADNSQTLGLFRSVITNGKKILAFSAPKSVSYDLFNNQTLEGDREFLEFCEGIMILIQANGKLQPGAIWVRVVNSFKSLIQLSAPCFSKH